MSVKEMNNTLGPEGLVPSMLLFGEFPQMKTPSESNVPRATTEERSELAVAARREMEQHMAQLKVTGALTLGTPAAANQSYEPGDQVLVWRERQVEHRIGEWVGPFVVIGTDISAKKAFVRDSNIEAARPFKFAELKRYNTPENIAHSHILDLAKCAGRFATLLEDTFATEVLDRGDPRANSPKMVEAKRAEIPNLLKRGTFKIVLKEGVPQDTNVLPGRFVLAVKSTEDGQQKYKAGYVIGDTEIV